MLIILLYFFAVDATINDLERRFSQLQRRLSSELDSNSKISPEILVESLTLLPVQLKIQYNKLVCENLLTVKKEDSIRRVFHLLNPHISFIDYHLIKFLIEEFGSAQLKEDMSAYVDLVEVFYDETNVQQLMDYWPGRHEIPPDFKDLQAVIDEEPGTYTLRRLDDLRKEFCGETRLYKTVLILKRVKRKNSFIVCWAVPSMFVPELKSDINKFKSFCERQNIFSISIGTQRLYSIAVRKEL